jgi:hypothetical protein
MLLLPLRSDLGDVSRALGCLVVTQGRIGPAARRFNIENAQVMPLSGSAHRPPFSVIEGARTAPKMAARPRPHLRLVT